MPDVATSTAKASPLVNAYIVRLAVRTAEFIHLVPTSLSILERRFPFLTSFVPLETW